MSYISHTASVSGMGGVITLTGNSGGAVSPDGAGNINIVGSGGVNVAGSGTTLTITGGGLTWNEVTATSANMSQDNGYVSNNIAQVDLALPASATKLSVLRVKGLGTGGWKISQAAGQNIIWDAGASTTVGATGELSSTDANDAVELICVVADTQWAVLSSMGNITVT